MEKQVKKKVERDRMRVYGSKRQKKGEWARRMNEVKQGKIIS